MARIIKNENNIVIIRNSVSVNKLGYVYSTRTTTLNMTDCWQPYDRHGLDPEKHARCCSHLLRELSGAALFFSEDTEWAGQMIIELVRMNRLCNEYKAKGLTEFPPGSKGCIGCILQQNVCSD